MECWEIFENVRQSVPLESCEVSGNGMVVDCCGVEEVVIAGTGFPLDGSFRAVVGVEFPGDAVLDIFVSVAGVAGATPLGRPLCFARSAKARFILPLRYLSSRFFLGCTSSSE